MFAVSYIFIFIAALCNAFMDIVENENFEKSRLSKLNQKFWYKRESWKYAKKIFGWKFDSWHIAKSLMIFCFAFSMVFYKPFIPFLDFSVWGIIYIFTFNLFYNRIFKK